MGARIRDWPRFHERKALQAAARLLRLAGGRMNYMKLLKLLYLADRKALIERGLPVTTDRPVSMRCGPVPSYTYSLICDQAKPGSVSEFGRFIRRKGRYEVALAGDPGADELSRYETALLNAIWREHGGKTQWQLVDYTHTLPEWTDPENSSLEIRAEEILRGAGLPEKEVVERLALLAELRRADEVLAP